MEACNQLNKRNERVVVKYFRRKDCQNVLCAKKTAKIYSAPKKEFRNLDLKKLGFLVENLTFLKRGLCAY